MEQRLIHLRPYYLYTIFRQLEAGDTPVDTNSLPELTRALIAGRFEQEIELVGTFCDACRNCVKMAPDPAGCLWGEGFKCQSTGTAARLNQVEDQMRSIMYDLGMRFGQRARADRLLCLAAERRPFHYFHNPAWQAAYERGVSVFTRLTGLVPQPAAELLARKRHYLSAKTG